MSSLAELYAQMASYDVELAKEAEQQVEEQPDNEDAVKVAAEYDAAGRIMARTYFGNLLKAAEEAEKEDKEEEKGKKGKEEEEEEEDEEEGEDEKSKRKKNIKKRMLKDPEFAKRLFAQHSEKE